MYKVSLGRSNSRHYLTMLTLRCRQGQSSLIVAAVVVVVVAAAPGVAAPGAVGLAEQ